MVRSMTVTWERGEVTLRLRGVGEPLVLLAHGAGTNQDHPLVAGPAEALAAAGVAVATFNYPYTEAGRRAPDRAPKLLSCHGAVLAYVREHASDRVVLAGRSMGGRMASMLVADGAPVLGLVLYAYPLHPAGKPDRLRIEHLPRIQVPMLFFQGTRDPLSRPDLFDRHVRPLTTAEVVDLEGADHSFKIRGVERTEVDRRLAEETVDWMDRHFGTWGRVGA